MSSSANRVIDIDRVKLEPDLNYSEYLVRVMDPKDCVTRRRTIKFYKVQWDQHSKEETTWESKDYPPENFLEFLASIYVINVSLGY
jgi:hypothetical protein